MITNNKYFVVDEDGVIRIKKGKIIKVFVKDNKKYYKLATVKNAYIIEAKFVYDELREVFEYLANSRATKKNEKE